MGLRPVCEMQFIDFISCGFDQIVNFAAKAHYRWGAAIPIVVRMEGTNVELGRKILQESGLNFTVADGMKDAAEKVVRLAQ